MRTGVRELIIMLNFADGYMRVYLSGLERLVAQQLTHRVEVGAGGQHLCGEGVTQHVR